MFFLSFVIFYAGGKKKNKTKGKTLALTEFLANDDGTVPAPVVNRSWAAEVENADQDGKVSIFFL